jgi:hypothetical protein
MSYYDGPCHSEGCDCNLCNLLVKRPARMTNDQKFVLTHDTLESAGWLYLDGFVEDVLGLKPLSGGILGAKKYFLPEVQYYLRIKAWLVAMGEFDVSLML